MKLFQWFHVSKALMVSYIFQKLQKYLIPPFNMLLSRFPVNIDQTKLCHVLLGNFKRWRKVYLRLLLRPIAQIGFNSRYWLYCNSNLRVSRTKIKNLRWQVSEDINFITCGKFVTSLVQKLKKKCVHEIVSQGTDYKSVYSHFFLQIFWRLPE